MSCSRTDRRGVCRFSGCTLTANDVRGQVCVVGMTTCCASVGSSVTRSALPRAAATASWLVRIASAGPVTRPSSWAASLVSLAAASAAATASRTAVSCASVRTGAGGSCVGSGSGVGRGAEQAASRSAPTSPPATPPR
ncbi:hypothetical protein IU11_08575 [Cellulosimicrobium sp. MM]|nr:hypothetical protein IU11_08575 [Cellulosimicrobium sp. MM]